MIVDFLVTWAVTTVLIRWYVKKKDIQLKVNTDVVVLIIAFILSGFLTLIQSGAEFLFKLMF